MFRCGGSCGAAVDLDVTLNEGGAVGRCLCQGPANSTRATWIDPPGVHSQGSCTPQAMS